MKYRFMTRGLRTGLIEEEVVAIPDFKMAVIGEKIPVTWLPGEHGTENSVKRIKDYVYKLWIYTENKNGKITANRFDPARTDHWELLPLKISRSNQWVIEEE